MATDRTNRVTVEFSTKGSSEFNRELTTMKTNMKNVDAQIRLASQNLKTYGTNITNLKAKQQALKTQMDNVRQSIEKYNTGIEKNQQKLKENQATLTQLTAKKKELTQAIKQAEQAYGKESQEAQKLRQELERTNQQYTETKNKIKDAEKAMDNYGNKTTQAKIKLAQLDGELKNINEELYKQTDHFYQAGVKLENLGGKLQKLGGMCTTVGNQLLAITAPLLGLMGLASKLGIDFEYQMDKVQAISGASAKEMELLTSKALEMGENTAKSAKNAGEAFEYMSLAGWGVNDMLISIEPMLKASVAYGEELSVVSDLITDTMGSLGLETKDLAYYLDIVSNAQNKSNTTAVKLLQAYVECGSVLNEFNVPLEESSTLLGVLSNNGQKGSEAGNALKSILVNLTKAGGESADALQQMGISAFDSEGKFKGFHTVLQEIQTAFSGMNDEQRATYASMIAGKEQLAPFQNLLKSLTGEYDNLYQAQVNSNGALNNMYDIMSDNTKTKIDEFLSKLEAFGLQLADVLLPHINNLLDKGMEFVDWLRSLDTETLQTTVNIIGLSAGLGGILKISGSLITGIGGITSSFGSMFKTISKGSILFRKFKDEAGSIKGKISEITKELDKNRDIYNKSQENIAKTKDKIKVATEMLTEAEETSLKTGYSTINMNEIRTKNAQRAIKHYKQELTVQEEINNKNKESIKILEEQLASQKEQLSSLKILGMYKTDMLALVGIAVAVGGAIYATTQYIDAMNNTCLVASEDMSLLEQAFTKFNGGTLRTRKELEQLGLVEKEFSKSLSEDFKKAVVEAERDVENFGFTLHSINMDGVITEEESQQLADRFSNACDKAIQALNDRESEVQASLQLTFGTDGLIDDNEQRIINFYASQTKTNTLEVERMQNEVNTILRKVREEGYVMTPEDEQKIREYYAELKRIELEANSDKSEEIEYAQIDFKNRALNIDAEGARKLLVQKQKELKDLCIEEQNGIDLQIQNLMRGYDDMSEEDKAYTRSRVEELENQKNEVGKKYSEIMQENYNYVVENNKNLENEIDRFTGKILSTEDKKWKGRLETMQENYNDMNKITESGCYKLYSKEDKTWHDVQVVVDEATGQMVEAVAWSTDENGRHLEESAGYNEKYAKSAQEMGNKVVTTYNSLSEALTDNKNTTVNANGEIVNSNGQVVGSLDDITESADGTREGIVMLGNTPVKVKFDDKTGVIQNANDIKNSIDDIPTSKDVKVFIEGIWGNIPPLISDGRGNVKNILTGTYVNGGYAEGGTVQETGIYGVNEEGWELVQGTARALSDTVMYAQAGTKVTNHLSSLEQMRRDIRKEVAKQGANIGDVVVNNEIVVQGNLDNVTLDDLDKVIAKNNAKLKDNIYSELNKVAKKY